MDKETKLNIRQAVLAALPLMLGYIPVAIAFGLLAKNTGLSLMDTVLFSLIVYAGASQFMALDLIIAGVSTANIILATFLLNLRHLMMSASLSLKLDNVKKSLLPIIGYGITDETFSLLSFKEGDLESPYVLTITVLAHLTWAAGTVLGYLIGEVLPSSLQSSLNIALYAMFAALLFPHFKIDKEILILSILTAVIYIIIYSLKVFTSGWDIIIGIILSSAIGVIILNKKEGVDE